MTEEEEQAALYTAGTRQFTSRQEEDDAIDDLFATLIPDDYELPPRECCGVEDDAMKDIAVPCSAGCCTVLHCRCGRSTESGYGRPDCRCQAEGWGHWRVFERKMISVRKIALSTKKKRSRTRGA